MLDLLLVKITYILMGVWFLMMGNYLAVTITVIGWIIAYILDKAFRDWI